MSIRTTSQVQLAEPIKLDQNEILGLIKKDGIFTKPGIQMKKWEADSDDLKDMFVANITVKSPYIGILSAVVEREGYAYETYTNGDRYLGYYSEDQRDKHGLYMFNPKTDKNIKTSEYYFGLWKDNRFFDHGVYVWLDENEKTKPFSHFDSANFEAIIGKIEKGKFVKATQLFKKGGDYYVYHGCFDNRGLRTGENSFLYSSNQDWLFYGKFEQNQFLEGYVVSFDDEGEAKDIIKTNEKEDHVTRKEKIEEQEVKIITEKMTKFRDIILGEDYFGQVYEKMGKAVNFANEEIKNIDYFNSDKYVDLITISATYNRMTMFNDIEKNMISEGNEGKK